MFEAKRSRSPPVIPSLKNGTWLRSSNSSRSATREGSTDTTTRDRRLATLTAALALDPVPIDQAVAETWARLRVSLRDVGLRMPVNDSWIAATAMTLGIPVVPQDDDYLHAPGLEVIHI